VDRSDVSGAARPPNAGFDTMVTSGAYEPEALGEDSLKAKSISTAGDDGDELQRQDERYTGRHRTEPDEYADEPDSVQPSA
jgi:hypothetical protein